AESSGAGSLAIGGDDLRRWRRPGPGTDIRLDGDHVDAIHRAGFHTQVTAGALAFDNGVHVLGGTQNGVHRAGLNTFGAADAFVFTDNGDPFGLLDTVLGVQRLWLYIQQVGQRLDGALATGRAFVDGVAVGNGFGIGPAAGEATLAALGLRQQRINLVNQRIAFNSAPFRGKSQ